MSNSTGRIENSRKMFRRERQPGHRRVAALGSKPGTLPRPRARCEASPIRQSASVATGLLFAGLAPAIVMAALWPKVAPIAFVFTFATAFCHAVLLGLPLFLIFRPMSSINVAACIVFGLVIGTAPIRAIIWSTQYFELYAHAAVRGVPTVTSGMAIPAGWITYVRALVYFGCFRAIDGFAFWAALISSGAIAGAAVATDRSQVS